MKQLVLTGAGGFLGGALLKQCANLEGITVYALTRQLDKIVNEFRAYSNIRVIDLEHRGDIPWEKIDVLIHAAFPMGNNGEELAKGLDFTKEIISLGVAYGCHVINISTQSVYSQKRQLPASEETAPNLESAYAIGKYATELITNSLCVHSKHTNIRLGSLIGVGLEQRLVNKFVKTLYEGGNLQLKGGKQLFEFMDVRDAAKAIIKIACSEEEEWEEAYNLGSGNAYNLEEIAIRTIKVVKTMLGKEGDYTLEVDDTWHNSSLNSDKFRHQFNIEAQYTLEDTIGAIIENNYMAESH